MRRTIAFVLAWLILIGLTACGEEEAAPGALPPQVMIDGIIYADTGRESTTTSRRTDFDGEITSTVSGDKQPTENDQSNFGTGFGYQFGEQEGTVDLYINGKWWLYATDEVREQIYYPERFVVVDRPPDLIVNCGEESIEARHCLTNWEFTMEDGMQSSLLGDGIPPMEAKHISPFLKLEAGASLEAWLYWEIMPDTVMVQYWGEECWDELQSKPVEEFRLWESNEVGDSYILHLKDGSYIYEVIATWHNAPNFGGTVHYSFHTET